MPLPAFLLLKDTAENRTLCRARALSKREAFVASGRGRRQAAEAGAGSRSEHADSPRKLSTRYGCDADPASTLDPSPSTGAQTAENRTLCRARALGKRVSVFSPRARTPAGGRSRCGFAKQIRGFSAQAFDSKRMRCLSNFSWPCLASANLRTAENRTLCRACFYLRKLRPGIATQNGLHFQHLLLTLKSSALPSVKLGRRRPKRNSRRST